MQPISPLSLSDLQSSVQTLLYKFEVYDGAEWVNVTQRGAVELLVDGSFEVWSSETNLTHWTEDLQGTSTVNREESVIHTGAYAARIDIDGSNSLGQIYQQRTVTPDKWYRAVFWYKTGSGKTVGPIVRVTISEDTYYLQADGSWKKLGDSGFQYYYASLTSTDWARHECIFKAPESFTSDAMIWGVYNISAASSSFYVDRASLSLLPYQLKTLTFAAGEPGIMPEPKAGTWSAELDNPDGVFHPYHPDSPLKDLLKAGREVRISIGGMYEGDPHYWQRLRGYIDETQFNNRASSVMLSGMDYMKRLADCILRKPYTHWGDSLTVSTQASDEVLGSELYTAVDAVGPDDFDDMSDWFAPLGAFSSIEDSGGGTVYVGELLANAATPLCAGYRTGPAVTVEKLYKVTFKYLIKAGGDDTAFSFFIWNSAGTTKMGGLSGLQAREAWETKTFYFTATETGGTKIYVHIDDPLALTQSVWFDAVTIKEVETYTNTRYGLPETCNGVYLAVLNGEAFWYGEPETGWLYDEENRNFYFVDGKVIEAGTDNLTIYYYTTQTVENVLADLLVRTRLYADQATALAAMDYTATGVTIDRVWFDAPSGISAQRAIGGLCERVNYRFWFDEEGTPHFQPLPGEDSAAASFTVADLSDAPDYVDRNGIKNRITIEGIECGMFKPREDRMNSRFSGESYDQDSIDAYHEKCHPINNHLFQDQASIDDMCDEILAEWKDPKMFADLVLPANPAPIQMGDTLEWEVLLRTPAGNDPGVKVGFSGIVRSIKFSGSEFKYKCEVIPPA